jgi:2,4-dienoyl-CoA reductase-like NADH-dependent reductase (Old Yellow Enzyme family)
MKKVVGGRELSLKMMPRTAVTPDGRTTYGDVGLYSDDCESAMGRVLRGVRRWSDMPIGIQFSHAGRKASRQKSSEGAAHIPHGEPNGWRTYGPSPIGFAAGEVSPVALDRDRLVAIRNAFAAAARRASRLGVALHLNRFFRTFGARLSCA